jgi:hypothetical protein
MAALIPGPSMSSQRPTQRLYRVTFLNQGQVYEIYARNVSHGGMMGFVEIEKIVFGERSSILVDPGEERLKAEFENVERTYVPVHAVVRIDQVSKPGPSRILPAGESGKVTSLPLPGGLGGEHRK